MCINEIRLRQRAREKAVRASCIHEIRLRERARDRARAMAETTPKKARPSSTDDGALPSHLFESPVPTKQLALVACASPSSVCESEFSARPSALVACASPSSVVESPAKARQLTLDCWASPSKVFESPASKRGERPGPRTPPTSHKKLRSSPQYTSEASIRDFYQKLELSRVKLLEQKQDGGKHKSYGFLLKLLCN